MKQSYKILTDTGCDIAPEKLAEWGVGCIDLTFHADGSTHEYTQAEMPTDEFYRKMRGGTVFRTSAANMEDFHLGFEPLLQQGQDILYLGFSSGLSSTVTTGAAVAKELQEKYPGRRIEVIDTLCASAGEGLFVFLAVRRRAEGAELTEAAQYLRGKVPHLCHWFTVDDLVYLKRGGCVKAAAAVLGGMLDIKPVLHVDDEGHLIPVSKIRGRKKSISQLADCYSELALDPDYGLYFISHGDCLADAKLLEHELHRRHSCRAALITDIGPVIGAHSGPGTLALFFLGVHR